LHFKISKKFRGHPAAGGDTFSHTQHHVPIRRMLGLSASYMLATALDSPITKIVLCDLSVVVYKRFVLNFWWCILRNVVNIS